MPRPKKKSQEKEVPKPHVVAPERRDQLNKVIGDINRRFGDCAIQLAKDAPLKTQLSYGIKEIDDLTGGPQRGNFTVVYGSPRTGKTSLAYTFIAKSQQQGLVCAYIDMERSFDAHRAQAFGINLEELVLLQNADTAEESMDIIITLTDQRVVDVVVLDSIQAMSPKGEQFEGKTDTLKSVHDDTMALLARKMSQFFRMCASRIHKANVAVVLIGQVRTMGIGGFAAREGLSSGKATLHWPVQILYMRHGQGADAPTEKVTVGGKKITRKIGFDCVLKLEKTKIFGSKIEGEEVHLPFYFKTGFKK